MSFTIISNRLMSVLKILEYKMWFKLIKKRIRCTQHIVNENFRIQNVIQINKKKKKTELDEL